MDEDELAKGRERWLDVEKMRSLMLKSLLAHSRTQAAFLVEILARLKEKEVKEVGTQYETHYKKMYHDLNDWIFQEFGEIDLKDIMPPDKTSMDNDEQD
jgi:hypothetical protein